MKTLFPAAHSDFSQIIFYVLPVGPEALYDEQKLKGHCRATWGASQSCAHVNIFQMVTWTRGAVSFNFH